MLYKKRYEVNDLVKFCSDENKVRQLLEDQGGYSPKLMKCVLGQIVRVKYIYSKSVKITYENRDFDIHPDLIENIEDFPDKPDNKSAIEDSSKKLDQKMKNRETVVDDKVNSLFKAISQGNLLEVCNKINFNILNSRDDSGRTPICEACAEGHKEIVETLLSFSADINIKDNDGSFPIHIAARLNHTEIVILLIKTDVNQMTKLDQEGKSLLHISVIHDNLLLTNYLISMKIDTNIKDKFEKTAFQYQSNRNKSNISEKFTLRSNPISLKTMSISSSISLPRWKKIQRRKLMSTSESGAKPTSFDTIEPISVGFSGINAAKTLKTNSNFNSNEVIKNQCNICQAREMKIAFIPCGHMACNECVKYLFECHLCHQEIRDKMIVYI